MNGVFGDYDELLKAFTSGRREPHIHEAADRVKAELVKVHPAWLEAPALANRSNLSERAARAGAEMLVRQSVLRRGRRKSGEIVYKLR